MEKTQDCYNLTNFVEEMTAVVEASLEDVKRVKEAEKLVGKLVRTKSWLQTEELISDDDHYARYSLYHDPQDRFEVIALVWKPGQRTPLHDHDGTWGVEGVFSGRIKVDNYLQVEKISDDEIKLFHTGSLTVSEQSTAQLLPPADCHILEADGDQPAITIHVYGKRLKSFLIYDALDEKDIYTTRKKDVGYTS
ncbi:cysteine dioxygenase family protein [Virgibacillus necropolis]|uniref:Cysteine dioxygenase n=1 Tax=Virgibacillus necropolis TaxID=163877 RepID=A0A221M741_9BACI|nr:cysteine dioxygenase family protein [Virgibacillus necropolis]ASN03520.1 cysteine dioxygenase [Virgibacillus necropolis]